MTDKINEGLFSVPGFYLFMYVYFTGSNKQLAQILWTNHRYKFFELEYSFILP